MKTNKNLRKAGIVSTVVLTGIFSGASLNANATNAMYECDDLGSGAELRTNLLSSISQMDNVKFIEGKCGEAKCGEAKCGEKTDTTSTNETKKEETKTSEDKTIESKCGEGTCGGE